MGFFAYYVDLEDHVTRALRDFMVRSFLRYVTVLTSFVAIGAIIVGIHWF